MVERYIYIYIYMYGFAARVLLLYIVWVYIKGGQVFHSFIFFWPRGVFADRVRERPAKDTAPGGL